MADYQQYKVDIDTINPNGKRGEQPRSAFLKLNELIDILESAITNINTANSLTSSNINTINTNINNIQIAIDQINLDITALDLRITALETP